jgi:hypothetical protein
MALETTPTGAEVIELSKVTLISLPFDLFTKIIAEILATVGVGKAVRLRQVSRADSLLVHSIFANYSRTIL